MNTHTPLEITKHQVEGDPAGFAEEYPLEALEISTSDYMAKASHV